MIIKTRQFMYLLTLVQQCLFPAKDDTHVKYSDGDLQKNSDEQSLGFLFKFSFVKIIENNRDLY